MTDAIGHDLDLMQRAETSMGASIVRETRRLQCVPATMSPPTT